MYVFLNIYIIFVSMSAVFLFVQKYKLLIAVCQRKGNVFENPYK